MILSNLLNFTKRWTVIIKLLLRKFLVFSNNVYTFFLCVMHLYDIARELFMHLVFSSQCTTYFWNYVTFKILQYLNFRIENTNQNTGCPQMFHLILIRYVSLICCPITLKNVCSLQKYFSQFYDHIVLNTHCFHFLGYVVSFEKLLQFEKKSFCF